MTTTPAWRQAPRPLDTPRRRPRLVDALLAAVIGFAGPLAATVADAGPPPVLVVLVAVAVAATAATRRTASHRWDRRLAVAIGTAAVLTPVAGIAVAVWGGAGLLLGHWATSGDPPLPRLPRAGAASLAPVTVLVAVAAVAAAAGHAPWPALVPFVLALTLPVVSTLGGGLVPRAAERLGHAAATAVAAVSFSLLGLVVVAAPWALHRLARLDALPSEARWIPRRRRDPQPTRLWARDPDLRPAPLARRVRTGATAVLVVGAVLVATPLGSTLTRPITSRTQTAATAFTLFGESRTPIDPDQIRHAVPPGVRAHTPGPDEPQAALAGDPWHFGAFSASQGWAFDPSVAWRPINPYRLLDFRSRDLNVVDGRRATWSPPPCDCERLTVWMYGGSTTYGLNQRDDHTIASEIARVSHEGGLTVDVENRGALGHLHWMEAERFAWDLTIEDPPDLVLFYDGVNDQWAGQVFNDRGIAVTDPMIDPTTIDVWRSSGRGSGGVPGGPPGSRFVGRPSGSRMGIEEMAATVIGRYDRSRALSRTSAERHGVVARYVWQPNRLTRPLVPAEPHGDTDEENRARALQQLMVAALPEDVIDATDALLGTDEPLFTDDVHHNELGARLVAEAIVEALEPDLRRILTVKEEGR